jgi:protein-tyrosine kinase
MRINLPRGLKQRKALKDGGLSLREEAVADRLEPKWVSPSGFGISAVKMPAISALEAAPVFSELATLLINGHLAQGRRAIAVCGAAVGAGVSFVSANLAAAVANSGTHCLLIETNMRAPELMKAIQPPAPVQGLSDFLLDERLQVADILNVDVIPGLDVIFAGRRCDKATDLLTSARFAQLAQACFRDSEFTILDTAPSNLAADARIVAREAGYALIVARNGRSFYQDIELLSAQLVQDGVVSIGSVMNQG